MNFGEAIEALKDGKRVQRDGWNGKGMWIAYMPAMDVPERIVNVRTMQFVPGGDDLHVGGYIAMWTAEGVWQPGWLASQPDMLSEDWSIVDEP